MRFLFLFYAILFCSAMLQSQSVSKQIISSAGSNYIGNDVQLSWTMGELSIESLQSQNLIITQGFQQPEILITDILAVSSDIQIILFPNPTSQVIHLEWNDINKDLIFIVYDLMGKEIIHKESDDQSRTEIDLIGIPQGIYILNVLDAKTTLIKTFRILKMH